MQAMRFALPVLAAAALFAVQGLHYASILVPVPDGVQYLMIGAKAVRGELGVFDDRLPGNRMPLPFYVLGLTQLGGPDLLAARRLNVAFGTLTVLLVALVARQAAGLRAGVLAALFLATHGVVVAYFSYESYPAFAAFSFALCLTIVVMYGHMWPWRLLGALLVGGGLDVQHDGSHIILLSTPISACSRIHSTTSSRTPHRARPRVHCQWRALPRAASGSR